MTKMLNLNQLSPKEAREVQIGESVYKIREMSVEDFIETTKVAEEMNKDGVSYATQLNATMTLLKRSIPDIEDRVLMGLSLEQLRALSGFVRGEDPATLLAVHEAMHAEEGAQSTEIDGKK